MSSKKRAKMLSSKFDGPTSILCLAKENVEKSLLARKRWGTGVKILGEPNLFFRNPILNKKSLLGFQFKKVE